jgi:oligopeptide/dipeptide ABC transporter ATP-binding protein
VSFNIAAGRTLGVVGESGSGKSVTALSLLRLLPDGAGRITGEILFAGHDLAKVEEARIRAVRGRDIAIVFQDPMASLNPVLSIGRQLREPLRLHLGLGHDAASARAIELLDQVGIPSPQDCLARYPHELSGGQRQRVVIAMALSCGPKLLIADEPTTALDVTTQGQILDLLRDLQAESGMAVMLITHDLGVVAEFTEDVQVMYAGRIVERATTAALFAGACHPYTEALLRSIPPLDDEGLERLPAIEGMVPSPTNMPQGCAFHPRCGLAWDDCVTTRPDLYPAGPAHEAACLRLLPRESVP